MPYAAAAFAHFIEPTLTFIVSGVAMNAASVAFLFSRFLQKASTLLRPSMEGALFYQHAEQRHYAPCRCHYVTMLQIAFRFQ